MPLRNAGYLHDVDALHDQTPLSAVLDHYGLPAATDGEYRMQCVFNESCGDSSYGQLAVNVDTKEIYCHSCGVRGNLYTLLHGLEQHRPPTGSKLRGREFKDAYATLKAIANREATPPSQPSSSPPAATATAEPSQAKRNPPLSANEKTRSLENLYEDLIGDPADMTPNAAGYFRQRQSWLTPEVCRKWDMGYLPRNGRSMFKGWVTYAHRNEQGQVISYSGRDTNYDEKLRKWQAKGRPVDEKPLKHKYVKGYHRGLELYGQQRPRLEETAIAESLAVRGLGIVEGMNDVIRLDCLGVAAVGLCSNKPTDEQIRKITRFVRHVGHDRVWLMPDNDDEGEAGCKELLWQLSGVGLRPALAWSNTLFDGLFAGKQPEDVAADDWETIDERLRRVLGSAEE